MNRYEISGVTRGQYKQLCRPSWNRCKGDESELSFKIRRAVDLGKHVHTYKNKSIIIRYHYINFLVGDGEIMTMWIDKTRPAYDVPERLKRNYGEYTKYDVSDDTKGVVIRQPNKEDIHPTGFNMNIKISPKQTRYSLETYGFTNYSNPRLVFSKNLGDDISFSITVGRQNLEVMRIDVLDEDFLQPFDYQRMLLQDKKHEFAKEIYFKVNEILSKLQEDGIIVGFEEGMYV